MADFFEQAKAIWKALDEISEKDPEEYKRFISEQLQDGKNSVLQGSRSQSADKKTPTMRQGQPLEEAMEKLSLHSAPPTSTNIIKESGANRTKTNDVNVKIDKPGKEKVQGDKQVNLLDDEICEKSMISNIVKKVNRSNSTLDEEGDGDSDVVISELRIPSAESIPNSRARNRIAPLIEEL